jgi:hypothetical protein
MKSFKDIVVDLGLFTIALIVLTLTLRSCGVI